MGNDRRLSCVGRERINLCVDRFRCVKIVFHNLLIVKFNAAHRKKKSDEIVHRFVIIYISVLSLPRGVVSPTLDVERGRGDEKFFENVEWNVRYAVCVGLIPSNFRHGHADTLLAGPFNLSNWPTSSAHDPSSSNFISFCSFFFVLLFPTLCAMFYFIFSMVYLQCIGLVLFRSSSTLSLCCSQ